ncbi:MAG: UDP-galactose-lipid carrier transferase [Chthoniobacterales bacterium]|nr:UDP-galactose-lipid carrier transferase [Chthoniobacterales bacterium]
MANKDRISLDGLDQSGSLEQEDYKKQLKQHQLQLLNMQMQLRDQKRSVVLVMEGPDAAGKGGAIKRVVERLDPRLIKVYSIVKPTPEELAHHYLWRFWTKLPAEGEMTIFDRSWYGRVLVERVEAFCSGEEWKRAYREINEFERTLTDGGTVLIKIFLQITKEEQLDRFKRREADPYKHWKISDEDWRNRRHWNEHNKAAEDMFEKTSTDVAPWTVIPANFKWYARVRTLKTVCAQISKVLKA